MGTPWAALYHAGVSALQHELPRVSDEVETLLVLGHNPGWEDVVFRLCGEAVTMKTATAVLLQAECESWNDAFCTKWSVASIIYPREID